VCGQGTGRPSRARCRGDGRPRSTDERTAHNQSEAARRLGLNRATLIAKMKKYAL
jgi:DNA-binding NtrC family response regulator